MEQAIYGDIDKQPAIEYCKNHIKTNGYCAVQHAVKMGVPGKTFKGDQHKRAFYNSVSSLITRDGKYRIKHRYADGNIDIEVNPDHKRKGYFERHPFIEKATIALLSALLTLTVNLILTKSQKQAQHQIDMQQDQLIEGLRDSVDILQKRISDSAK